MNELPHLNRRFLRSRKTPHHFRVRMKPPSQKYRPSGTRTLRLRRQSLFTNRRSAFLSSSATKKLNAHPNGKNALPQFLQFSSSTFSPKFYEQYKRSKNRFSHRCLQRTSFCRGYQHARRCCRHLVNRFANRLFRLVKSH